MKNYQIKLLLKESDPCIWRVVQVPVSFTYEQLHDVIQQGFGWENIGAYDITYADVIISLDKKAKTEVKRDWKDANETMIQEDMKAGIAFLYHYDENWQVEGQIMSEVEGDSYPIITAWEGESVCDYCEGYKDFMRLRKNLKSKDRLLRKEARNYFEEYVMEFDLDDCNTYFEEMYGDDEDDARLQLSNEISAELNQKLQEFEVLIQDLHKPYLFAIKLAKDVIIYAFFDEVDDGKELMIFTDVNNFCRSVINSNESLSDMFFTDSLTINFMEDEAEVDASSAFFDEHRTVAFFRNAMGSAQLYPTNDEASVATLVLERLIFIIATHKELPSLEEQRMCHISPDLRLLDKPFEVKEECCTIALQKSTVDTLKQLPHKQDTMEVFLVSIPIQEVQSEYAIDTYCIFRAEAFFEIYDIKTHDIMAFSDEIASHLIHVVNTFGLPKRMLTNSLNLAHSLEGFTSALKISLEVQDEEESLNAKEFAMILGRSGSCSNEQQQLLQALAQMDDAQAIQYLQRLQADTASQEKRPKLMN